MRELLKKLKIDYLLVNSTNEYLVEYSSLSENARHTLTGFSGSTGDALVTKDNIYLFDFKACLHLYIFLSALSKRRIKLSSAFSWKTDSAENSGICASALRSLSEKGSLGFSIHQSEKPKISAAITKAFISQNRNY